MISLTTTGPGNIPFGKAPEELSISLLTDHIITTHHDYIRRELPRLLYSLQTLDTRHRDRYPWITAVLDTFIQLKKELEWYMLSEELILFPRIKELQAKNTTGQLKRSTLYLGPPIKLMEEEHDQFCEQMAAICRLTDNYTVPQNACPRYRLAIAALQVFSVDLCRHLYLENDILFPRSLAMLDHGSCIAPDLKDAS